MINQQEEAATPQSNQDVLVGLVVFAIQPLKQPAQLLDVTPGLRGRTILLQLIHICDMWVLVLPG
jgi:hypothetical protein